jgi:hypothetical protein
VRAAVFRIWAPTTITGMSLPVDEWFILDVFPREVIMSAPQPPQQPGRPAPQPPQQPAQPAPQAPPPSAPTPAAPRQERPDPFAEEVQ